MWVDEAGYNKPGETQNPNELMALRDAFLVPLILALIFLLFDLYHVYTQPSCMEDGKSGVANIFSLYWWAALRAINSYFPSTLLPFAVFVVIQQGIYKVFAGISRWKLGSLLMAAVFYVALYVVYIVQGSSDPLLVVVLAAVTIFFGFNIWFSLDGKVRGARSAWREIIGAKGRVKK